MRDNSHTGTRTRSFLATAHPTELDWFEFVERYGPRVLKWCRSKGLSRQDSEQVAQDVLVRLSRSLHTFKAEGNSFRGWLFGVTRHAIADYRNNCKRGEVQLNDAAQALLQSSESFIDDIVASDIEQIAIARTSERVQARHWQAFVMRVREGREYSEIADIMRIEVAALQNYVSAVRAALTEEIEKLFGDNADGP
jgi:RNA polymerase sigma factor (sigma-70 family)